MSDKLIEFETKDYGKILFYKFPWMDHSKGIGLAAPDLEEKDYVQKE